jgi:Sec-independent protein translocase protein TatA
LFGIGPQELLLIGVLVLVVFGPMKAASMARDLGRFVNGANRTVEQLKEEILSEEEVKEACRTAKAFKEELPSSGGEAGTYSARAAHSDAETEGYAPRSSETSRAEYKPS